MSDTATPGVAGASADATPHAGQAPVDWPDAGRRQRFDAWLATVALRHALLPDTLRPASADASFRRYLRLDADASRSSAASYVVMDAPPPHEDVRPFVDIAARIAQAGLAAPRVLEADADAGFLLLTDLGNKPLLGTLQSACAADAPQRADALMRDAVRLLVAWQTRLDPRGLPAYDDALLRRELALFPDWCVQREHGVQWTDAQAAQWAACCDQLVASALGQPTLAVHRDFMPRNLMVLDALPNGAAPAAPLALLDFQDAVIGPIGYDLASLLRDAFIDWDEEQELHWAVRYWQQARAAGLPVDADFGEFWRAVEWVGLQRHLKVLGIFCRLKHRDAKPAYSADLPRFFGYAHKAARRYRALVPLALLLEPLMGAERREAFY